MAITNIISLKNRFQLNNTPQNFKITDDTDYASEGIDPANVIGALIIKNPLGDTFHSTILPSFDIDNNVQDYIDTILLPKDSAGVVMKGTYEVSYTIRVSGGVQDGDYEQTFFYDYCYEDVIPDVDLTVDLICSTLTSTDNTSYPVQMTSNTRTHTIHPPVGLDPVDYPVKTAATAVLTYNPITTKTWTGKIVNILELTFPASGSFSEHIIDVTITGNTEKEIVDDINICSLQCNIRALTERYNEALGTNTVNAVKMYNDQVAPALLAAFNYTASIQCGNFALAEQYYQDVLRFTKSNKDCECGASSEPTLIVATCSSGTTLVIQEEGSNLPIQGKLNFIGAGVTATDNPATGATDVTITNSGHIIEEEGTPLAAQPSLNFIGAGVTATDNAGNSATDITITSGGHIIEEEGTPLAVQPSLNFIGGGVTATDNAGNSATDVKIPSLGLSTVLYFEAPAQMILNATNLPITGTPYTVPSGGAGTYKFVFDGELNNNTDLIMFCEIRVYINSFLYNGIGGLAANFFKRINLQKDISNPFTYIPITFTKSQITLAVGDVIELRATGTSTLNANRLVNYSYELVKLT